MANGQRRVSVFDDTELSKASDRIIRRQKRKKTLYAVISALLIAAALFVAAAIFCRVSAVEISGTGLYTDKEIMNAAGIKYGMQLFSIKRSEASAGICKSLSGIESAKIGFALPNKVKISITEGEPFYYFEAGGKLYYISEKFIALGSSLTVTEEDKLCRIDGAQIKKYVAGSKVTFYDDDWYYIIESLVSSLKMCGLYDKLTVLETTDKFNIAIRYDGRIKVALGEFANIEEKLEFAKSTIDSLEIDAVGTIRIKNYKVGSFLRGEY